MEVKVTITEKCNAKCTSCLTHKIQNPRHMSLDTFKRIVDQIVQYKDQFNINKFHLYSIGESFLNPNIQEMIDYATSELSKAGIWTVITTNGSIDLTKFNVSAVSEVIISFNAYSQEIYEKHIGLSWDRVLENIDKISNERHIGLHILNYNDEKEISTKLMNVILKETVHARVGYKVDNQCGELYEDNSSRIPCTYVLDLFCFNPNGDVILCAHDFFSQNIYGNINDSELPEIYDRKIIDIYKHKNGNYTGLCEKCNFNKPITEDDFYDL